MKKFKPKLDKLFFIVTIITLVLIIGATAIAILAPIALLIMIGVDIFALYFLFSPLFGYVELREDSLFVKFGFIMKREIPYSKIRGLSKERKVYADSMLSLKGALEHVNIKYNSFDIVSVSVCSNDELIEALQERLG